MTDAAGTAKIDQVLRALATAARSLRLYPPASPIPLQSIQTVVAACDEYFSDGAADLSLSVAREGFSFEGQAVSTAVPGARELADELRLHSVAQIVFRPGLTADELSAFLTLLNRTPEDVRAEGGLAALALANGVNQLSVTDVQLTVVDGPGGGDEGVDIESFLRNLGGDSDRLATWFASAAGGDPAAFEESLLELVRAAGPSGFEGLVATLADAFLRQEPDAKDALLRLAMDAGPVREVTAHVFGRLESVEIAGAILGGGFGRNMLSLSSALTRLPLAQVTAEVRSQVEGMLPGSGHTNREAEFLDHMLDVRALEEPEAALVDADRTYRAVLQAATVDEKDVERARGAVQASGTALNTTGVRTMLTLLDQQTDFELYCAGADNLAGMVPRLVEQGELDLVLRVLTELANRQARSVGPWPELSGRLQQALAVAAGPRAMRALVGTVIADPSQLPLAREIVRHGGDAAGPTIVEQAVADKAEGIRIAEELLGRRVIDLLNAAAPSALWYQVAPVVERLAAEDDARSTATIRSLLASPDAQIRREAANGLVAAGTPLAQRLLPEVLRDANADVAVVAVRAIARSGAPGSAVLLYNRAAELDLDNADFAVGREIISALARSTDPETDQVLAKLASRRALIKRGHFAEIQQLLAEAQNLRARGGGRP